MIRRLLGIAGACFLGSGMLIGCMAVQAETSQTDRSKIETELLTHIEALEKEQDALKTRIDSLEKEKTFQHEMYEKWLNDNLNIDGGIGEIRDILQEVSGMLEILAHSNLTIPMEDLLIVYGAKVKDYRTIPIAAVERTEDYSIKEQLQGLLNQMSAARFQNLEIKIESIEQRENKKIAIVNMIEPNGLTNEGATKEYGNTGKKLWLSFSQGTAGGGCTMATITETVLQRQYSGEWVDGMKLLYNGTEEMIGHMEQIGEIILR